MGNMWRRARDIALFGGLTAVSGAAIALGAPVAGLVGLLIFGGGGAAYLYLTRDSGDRAPASPARRGPLSVHGTLPGAASYTERSVGLVFPTRRGMAIAVTAGAAGFVVVGVLLLVIALRPDGAEGEGTRVLLIAVGVLAIVVFGFFAILGLISVVRARRGIALLPEGVYLRAPAGRAWVSWDQIAEVSMVDDGTSPGGYLAVLARSPEAITLTGPNRWLHRLNRERYGMDLGYPCQYLRQDPAVVLAEIHRYWADPTARHRLDDPSVLDETEH